MSAAPLSEPDRKVREVDLGLVTVLAVSWFIATVATALTLWLLVGVIGNA